MGEARVIGANRSWMVLDGRSRPWNIGAEEQGEELRERWSKENAVRLMAEGRMIGWNELTKLVDGAVVRRAG